MTHRDSPWHPGYSETLCDTRHTSVNGAASYRTHDRAGEYWAISDAWDGISPIQCTHNIHMNPRYSCVMWQKEVFFFVKQSSSYKSFLLIYSYVVIHMKISVFVLKLHCLYLYLFIYSIRLHKHTPAVIQLCLTYCSQKSAVYSNVPNIKFFSYSCVTCSYSLIFISFSSVPQSVSSLQALHVNI